MAEDEYHHQSGTQSDSGNHCPVCLRIHDDDINGDEPRAGGAHVRTTESRGTASPAAATYVLWYRLHCDRSHWVCGECFRAWAKKHSGLTTCPLCRCKSTEYTLVTVRGRLRDSDDVERRRLVARIQRADLDADIAPHVVKVSKV